ncbi:capsule assembly Wzi family protein [Dyadobacter koreensis]|nr:capsule assembly Wzi family protein [Dyadobacter koreensis]
MIPLNGTFANGQFALNKIYNPSNPRAFQWSAGVELITNYGNKADVFFTDLFVAGKAGPVELMVGQKKNMTGLVDSLMTSGSLAVSGNSRPMPRVQISIPDFFPLAFTNDFLAVKASYSDGILDGSRIVYGSTDYVSSTYLHQKSFYLRIGNHRNKINILTGFNHQAIWGGEDQIMPVYNLTRSKAYWHVITGKTLDYKKIGTHFGTIDLAATYKDRNWNYYIYRQNIYETGSLFKINNFSDGLNGIKIQRNSQIYKSGNHFIINSFLVEFLSTQNQTNTNPDFGLLIFEKGNYFNSLIYSNGWSYKNRGIGTPLSPSKNLTNENLPKSGTEFTNNNRITAVHSGVSASWLNTVITVRATYSVNKGTYISPFSNNSNQVSLGLNAEKRIKQLNYTTVTAGLYSDFGKLYPNATSFTIGVRRSGYIN